MEKDGKKKTFFHVRAYEKNGADFQADKLRQVRKVLSVKVKEGLL